MYMYKDVFAACTCIFMYTSNTVWHEWELYLADLLFFQDWWIIIWWTDLEWMICVNMQCYGNTLAEFNCGSSLMHPPITITPPN